MPGLKIAHYLFDVHYAEPTRVYAVVELPNGDLRMDKIYEMVMTLAELLILYGHLEIRRPVVLIEPHPRVIEEFRRKGIRVR